MSTKSPWPSVLNQKKKHCAVHITGRTQQVLREPVSREKQLQPTMHYKGKRRKCVHNDGTRVTEPHTSVWALSTYSERVDTAVARCHSCGLGLMPWPTFHNHWHISPF
jgi:hypothetical protein